MLQFAWLDMVAAPPPPNFRGDLKILDQNNWEGPEQKIKFGEGGGLNLRGDLKFYGGPMNIVGEGGHTPPLSRSTPPFLRFPPFLTIQDVPTFHRSLRKSKALNNSCNQFVYHFYRRSIVVLEECLQKW